MLGFIFRMRREIDSIESGVRFSSRSHALASVETSIVFMKCLTSSVVLLRMLDVRSVASWRIRRLDCRKRMPSVPMKMGTANSVMPRLSLLESFWLILLMAVLLF